MLRNNRQDGSISDGFLMNLIQSFEPRTEILRSVHVKDPLTLRFVHPKDWFTQKISKK